MKAVLMSIQPKWCELIANGKKTVEVRKTKPKLETPFKVYIYCAKNGLQIYGNEKIYVTDTAGILNKNSQKGFEKTSKLSLWNGKVIGEFVCNSILSHCEMANVDIAEQQGCIKREPLFEYANGKELFGWHISDLVIYDKPKELSEFYRLGKPLICDGRKCEICVHWKYMQVNSDEWDYDCDCQHQLENYITLKRPPQSWCYVEEKE